MVHELEIHPANFLEDLVASIDSSFSSFCLSYSYILPFATCTRRHHHFGLGTKVLTGRDDKLLYGVMDPSNLIARMHHKGKKIHNLATASFGTGGKNQRHSDVSKGIAGGSNMIVWGLNRGPVQNAEGVAAAPSRVQP
jgi:hypothetical protein